MEQAPLFRCHDCKIDKTKDQFDLRKRNDKHGTQGKPSSRCSRCAAKERERNEKRKRKRNEDGHGTSGDPGERDPTISLDRFMMVLHEQALTGVISFSARVSIQGLDGEEDGIRTAIVARVWEATGFRFTYRTKHTQKNGTVQRQYDCCQTTASSNHCEKRLKTGLEQGKQGRDARRMSRFACNGMLYLTARDEYFDCALTHSLNHIRYKDIRIPEKWRQYITENQKLGPTRIWRDILTLTEGGTDIAFTQKAVRYHWISEVTQVWKCDDDPIESAIKWCQTFGAQENVEIVDMVPVPHSKVFAFVVKDFMEAWAHHTDSFLVDSTFNTNRSNMELFGGMADMLGEGLPLSYLFVVTDANAPPHTKVSVLVNWMEALKARGITPEFTLSDKDPSEINALGRVWPKAKHQLCLWHVARAVKRRLANNREPPAFYGPVDAMQMFEFIDPAFVPLGQMSKNHKATIQLPPEKPKYPIRLLLKGRPPVYTPGPTAKLNVQQPAGSVNGALSLPEVLTGIAEGSYAPFEQHGAIDGGEELSDVSDEEESDMIVQVAKLAMERDEETEDLNEDSDEDSDINAEEGSDNGSDSDYITREIRGPHIRTGVSRGRAGASSSSKTFTRKQVTKDKCEQRKRKKKNLSYEFCPLPHRPSILRLLTKHFCLHSLLPERHGQPRSSEEIHRDSVHEMYLHCKNNNLREVWAYLWVSWYSPNKWRLWARSAHPHAIPRKRTTMVVEAMWRNFKRLVLYLYNRPRVDFAAYALVTQALPAYRNKVVRILDDPRRGRATALHGEQIPIKKAWLLLRDKVIRGEYDTNEREWTCSCGRQKYEPYLLCKHLVQKLPRPHPEWWATLVRRHTPPFYDIRELLPLEDRAGAPEPEVLGNHSWLARMLDMPVGPDRPAVAPLPIFSSPSRTHPAGIDGIPRESVPSGFLQPQSREEIHDEVRVLLEESLKLWNSQKHKGSTQWLTNFKEQFKPGFKCTSDNLTHANRRTCPKTNETDHRGQPLPRNVIGYMSFDK